MNVTKNCQQISSMTCPSCTLSRNSRSDDCETCNKLILWS